MSRELVTAVLGLASLAIGAALIYLPAAFLVVGAGLLVYAIFLYPSGGPQP